MFKKLLASLPATILATTAFAQPIYFTANEFRAAPNVRADTQRPAAEHPAYPGQAIYFTANKNRAASPVAAVGNAVDRSATIGQPIYFVANKLRAGAEASGAAVALGAHERAPAN